MSGGHLSAKIKSSPRETHVPFSRHRGAHLIFQRKTSAPRPGETLLRDTEAVLEFFVRSLLSPHAKERSFARASLSLSSGDQRRQSSLMNARHRSDRSSSHLFLAPRAIPLKKLRVSLASHFALPIRRHTEDTWCRRTDWRRASRKALDT